MQEWDDIALLREYVDHDSEEAFAMLVTRHVNKVYSVALRHTRNPHQAEEITQAVFVILAKKSRHLGRGVVLSGWLYQTARLAAVTFIRSEIRRARREQEAQMQTWLNETESDVWMQIAPLLDKAMAGLNEKDRSAVVLRFFDGRSLREIGAALGGSEDAAKMRVNRAVEKLRQFFTRRGVVFPAAVLTTAIAANSVQAAPAALAHTATAVAFAKGATASGSTLTIIKGALKVMAWAKAKTAIIAGAAIVVATGATPLLVETVRSAHTTYPDIQGAWENVEDTSQLDPAWRGNVHQVLKVSRTNGAYQATVDLIETGQTDFPITTVAYKNGTLRLQIHTWGYYEGTVDPAGTQIHGFFMSWNGRKAAAVWKRTTHPAVPPPPLAESDYAPTGNSALQGFWEGYATVKGIPMRENLKISEPSPGSFRAEVDDLIKGLHHVPVTVAYNKPTVKLTTWWGGESEATMNSSNTEFRCSMPAGSPDIPWTFKRGHQEPTGDFSFTSKTDWQGHWQGTLKSVDGIKLRFNLHIARLSDGKFSATLDSLDQGSSGALATAVRYRPPEVRIEWVWMKCSFEGKLEHGELSGVFSSVRSKVPVVFQRSDLK
jgi:RNA polymerase sigma factor (sigma-70 family)